MDNQNHPLVVNIRNDTYDVYIGRLRSGPHYGNPFSHIGDSLATVIVSTREDSIQNFEDWLDGIAWLTIEQERRHWILKHISELRNKRLGCFCVPQFCHGTPLAIRANR